MFFFFKFSVPIKGIEPNDIQDMSPDRKPFLSAFAEDIGIEPNTRRYISLSRRTLSPSRFIFLCRHSRNRTYMGPINLSTAYQTEGICAVFGGQGRVRSYTFHINSMTLSQLSYLSSVEVVGFEPTRLSDLIYSQASQPNAQHFLISTKIILFFNYQNFCVPGWIRTNGLPVKSGRLEPDSATRTYSSIDRTRTDMIPCSQSRWLTN